MRPFNARKERVKNKFKVNQIILYVFSNSFKLFLFILIIIFHDIKIK